MPTIIMTKGLPGCGKSTWAKQHAKKGGWTRVNFDDLRAMMHDGKWTKSNEKVVQAAAYDILETALDKGHNVIFDNTNLHPKHETHLRIIARERGVNFEVKDFTDVPVETCIKRDLMRERSVGEAVIREMWARYIFKAEERPFDESKPDCIIVDIDGTLAHMKDRGPFDWDRVGEDDVDWGLVGLLNKYKYDRDHTSIVLLSGRDSVCREQTGEWIERHGIPCDALFMRAEGDQRRDSIVKRELFEEHIGDRYNVLFVIDDRQQVINETWLPMGLHVIQSYSPKAGPWKGF